MYAISFDIDTNCLKEHFTKENYNNAYSEIKTFMINNGFEWKQGSLYFGDPSKINAVICVTTVQRMAKQLPWFVTCVKDIRMLRIEENNDLMDAIHVSF